MVVNFLDTLQVLTNEGIDFTREKVFETPHPYPQTDYSQSETIEVPKAIGFIVELDKRCSVEPNNSDHLIMYSGSDHIFNINNNFATQIKLSNKPNTKQPYFLLGSRMKVEFRSYNLRQRRGHHPPPSDANKDAKDEVRWGYKILVRPIFSEPQNIILNGLSKQRHQVYKKLGGEESTHKIEQMLNQLVCLTSQLTKEMISVDNFVPIKSS